MLAVLQCPREDNLYSPKVITKDLADTLCLDWRRDDIHSISHKAIGACLSTLILKKIHSEMVLFQPQVTKVEQSYFDSDDLAENLTRTFEIIVKERTKEAHLSSELLALLVVNHQSTSP